jgi:hypothetical protein
MTLPASGTITYAQICAEFGLAIGSVFPTAFYGKGGAPSSGALSFSDFYGRSGQSAATYTPVAGTYNYDNGGPGGGTLSKTITASRAVTWTFTITGTNSGSVSSNVASGNSAASITFTMTAAATSATRTATVTLTANDGVANQSWTLNLTTYGSGGGVGGATMTL